MKTLPEVVDDLQALAAFMIDQAEQLNEVLSFFGGVTAVKPKVTPPPPRPAAAPPAPPPTPPPPALVQVAQIPVPASWQPASPAPGAEPQVYWNPGQQPYISEVPEEEEQQPEKKARKKSETGGRPLSKEEKAGIRKDWESFPKHLRTVENRRALASKWNCSGIQVFALVREDGHQMQMSRRSATGSPGGQETRRN